MNVNPKTQKVRSNAFRPPSESEEISVNRIDYCGPDFCKKNGRLIQKPEQDRTFWGLGILTAHEIESSNCTLNYSPIKKSKDGPPKNPYHADILIGYKVERGEPLPIPYSIKVDSLVTKSRYYKDPQPDQEYWGDSKIS